MTNGNDSAFVSTKVRKVEGADILGNSTINFITENDYGLTKREYIAAVAMQGILGNSEWSTEQVNDPPRLARTVVIYADALIAELNRSEVKP